MSGGGFKWFDTPMIIADIDPKFTTFMEIKGYTNNLDSWSIIFFTEDKESAKFNPPFIPINTSSNPITEDYVKNHILQVQFLTLKTNICQTDTLSTELEVLKEYFYVWHIETITLVLIEKKPQRYDTLT